MQAPDPQPVRIYRASRTLTRAVGAFFVALGIVFVVAVGSVVLLVIFGLMGALFLVAGERRRVLVSASGVRSVSSFGRSRTYAWNDIEGFAARQYFAKYSGWVVAMNVRDAWVDLEATRVASVNQRTRTAVQATADRMNQELAAARGGRGVEG